MMRIPKRLFKRRRSIGEPTWPPPEPEQGQIMMRNSDLEDGGQ